MTDKLRQAAQQALEALLEIHPGNMTPMAEEGWNKAITALDEALAEPAAAQESAGTYHLGACIVDDMLHATVMRKEPNGDVTVLLCEKIAVELLKDRDVIASASTQQAAPAEGDAAMEQRSRPAQHEGMTIAGNGASELGQLMREQWALRGGVYPDGNPNAAMAAQKGAE